MHDDHGHEDHGTPNVWADRINEAYYDAMGVAFGRKTRERINWMCRQALGSSVLDVGCSQGIASILMAREGLAVTGLDIYPPAIEYAMAERAKEIESVQQRLDFHCGELASLDGTLFDTVVMGEVVEHQTNPVRFIRQGASRVAPRGRIIITVPYGLNPWPDHKSSIFPRDIQEALSEEFTLRSVEVTDGYIRVVADRRDAAEVEADISDVLLRATEAGALDAQSDYYAASATAQEQAKAKGALEQALKHARDEKGTLLARKAELEREVAILSEQASGLKSGLEMANQASADRGAEHAEVLRAQREDSLERTRLQRSLADDMERRRDELAQQLVSLQVEIAAVRATERAAAERALTLQGEVQALRAESDMQSGLLQEAVRAAHANVRELQSRIEHDNSRMRDMDADLTLTHVRAQELQATVEDGKQRMRAIEADLETARAHARDVHASMEESGAHARRLEADLSNALERERTARSTAEEDRARVRALEGDLADTVKRTGELQAVADALRERIRKMTADLAEAQEKRSGHWAKFEAEQERTKALVGLAQTLHEDNQLYEHSIALAIGRALLGLGRVRGIIAFPSAVAGVVRLYLARRAGTLPIKPLVLPPWPVPAKAAGQSAPSDAQDVSSSLAGAGSAESAPSQPIEQQEPPPRNQEDVRRLSVIGWEQASITNSIPVMSVLDEFSRECFAPHAGLIEARPDNWEGLLQEFSPRFLLAESAWRGNAGAWRYRIADAEYRPGDEFSQMVEGFRRRGLPTVFWNKEDPVHFDAFVKSATRCDVILTTSVESVRRYQSKTTARVEAMQFAAEDSLHNPQHTSQRNGRICFAGSYYAKGFEDRQNGQAMLLEAAKAYELDIYDRNLRADGASSEFAFPAEYEPYIRGRLGYVEIAKKYREYQVFLNVNSVDDSRTMFSRRVFELLASGTPVVSVWSPGIAETFGDDIVWQVKDRAEADEALHVLLTDPAEWRRRSLTGIRAVLSQHTFRHRFAQILSLVGERTPDPVRVIAISEVFDDAQSRDVLTAYQLQQTAHDVRTQLVLVCRDGFTLRDDLPGVRVVREAQVPLSQIIDAERETAAGAIVAILSPNAVYGRHYLQDAVHAVRYSGAAVVGKSSGGIEYEWGQALDPRSLVINTEVMAASGLTAGALLDDRGGLVRSFVPKSYAFDSANFAAVGASADRGMLLQKIEI
ncbi:glycosyltransferase family protein [Pseudoxanthomonas japonensis]|uniref:Spore protein YkvP/CgeB glycosyl transferase-like domain-containing protein n=1 Tax=Pseudoxanthomonas japonensis TaxID=69284 RepID=A0ABQ6ZJ88_9GAMM|nr:glycosyltransferase [Pseudoxanthomonas japonensis]KAF1726186.1 hypothetical protein CSC78_05860 [Pseudoxanthomonas japonensis]